MSIRTFRAVILLCHLRNFYLLVYRKYAIFFRNSQVFRSAACSCFTNKIGCKSCNLDWHPIVRRRRDSNPRNVAVQQFSRLPPSTTRPHLQFYYFWMGGKDRNYFQTCKIIFGGISAGHQCGASAACIVWLSENVKESYNECVKIIQCRIVLCACKYLSGGYLG